MVNLIPGFSVNAPCEAQPLRHKARRAMICSSTEFGEWTHAACQYTAGTVCSHVGTMEGLMSNVK